MDFDVKGKVEELVKKIQGEPELLQKFKSSPIKTVEDLIGVDLPDEQIKLVIAGIKTKLAATDLGDKLDGLKKLF